ncbi:hypothetical protein XI06_15120 [Bradyrhizobium sp. CCBAU 11434]|uniref:hypothetical protein n=1 Tax=Bradyrhizobium sp. CCBAU 11434 TaxID=1630885 RepID=UPI002306701F|nr:hypothetical protein [Bradyrhizobium sp. CCBAU 11434]MDA9521639.1 hypothetical protein [Bradyrhizobium sp. CCBAU 11434]
MSTPFELAAAQTSAAVDSVFGEPFTFVGMKTGDDVDAARIADPDRPAFDAIGAYVAVTSALYPHARGSIADDHVQKTVASQPLVSIDNANLQWAVVTGDRCTRQKTGEVFEISRPMPDGVKRTIFHLTARKR